MGNKRRVEQLRFSNFRGATQPVDFTFRGDSPVVLIFGENGAGKSTIADAIDFVCNSDFGSLRLRSGVRSSTHIVSSQGNARDLRVELIYGGQSWQATLQGSKPVTQPPGPPRAFVLRRADITRIMEATDSDRYKQLQEFITAPGIEQAEKTLREAIKALKDELQRATQHRATAQATLERFWEAEGLPEDDPLSWARRASQQPAADLGQRIEANTNVLAALDQAAQSEQAAALASGQLQHAQAGHALIEQELAAASKTQSNADLVATLQAARAYLDAHPEAMHCPVCAKPEAQASLLAQINRQLTQLQAIQALQEQLTDSAAVVQRASGAFDVAQAALRVACADLVAQVQATPGVIPQDLVARLAVSDDMEQARRTLQDVTGQRPALERRIQQDSKAVAQHTALRTHLAAIDELTGTVRETQALSDHLEAVFAIVEAERKRYVQDTVDTIGGTVSALYKRVHPDEPLGDLSFGIKPKTIGSLTLTSRFGDHPDVPPGAYYSESHLDTLGLCVYLALAKQAGNALVVLDDVLMSVDDPHLDRVIDLINDEAPNFGQVIITTHSRAWFDRMRSGNGMQAELIELYGWDLNHGMHHSGASLAVDELRTAVSARKLDRQAVASKAGVLLEQVLDDLTLRYNCSVPRKRPPQYTLGELSHAFDRRLRPLLRTEQLDRSGDVETSTALDRLLDAASADSWIRNQVGAHFNPNAAGISDAMVRKFGENVVALADAMICSHCHQLARKNKSGSYWECGGGCGKIRLYPLQAP